MKKKSSPRRKSHVRRAAPPLGHYPKGWDQQLTAKMAAYYDNQSDSEAIAEAEAAYRNVTVSMMPIPVELVPAVQKMIDRRRAG